MAAGYAIALMSSGSANSDRLPGRPTHNVSGQTSATNTRSSMNSAEPVVVKESFRYRMNDRTVPARANVSLVRFSISSLADNFRWLARR